jgi:S1-C subfamily serine protease
VTLLVAILVILGVVATVAAQSPQLIPPRQQRYPVALITAVEPNGPAWRAGLEVNDRIVLVDDVRILSLDDLRRALQATHYAARLTVISARTEETTTMFVYPESGRIGINAQMIDMFPYYPLHIERPYTY